MQRLISMVGKMKLNALWMRRKFSTPLLFSLWLLLSTNEANITVHLSNAFSSLPNISEMLAQTQTKIPLSCAGEEGTAVGKTEEAGWLRGLRCCPGWCVLSRLWTVHSVSFQVSVSSSTKQESTPSIASKGHQEVCLLMMLRMLGTYKYFLRRAGIFPFAIRLEEVCSVSSVHL